MLHSERMADVMSDELVELLNAVLGLKDGEIYVLREQHIPPSTVHRYRDGWHVLIDFETDNFPCHDRVIGWHFKHHEDICEFLLCEMGKRVLDFAKRGQGQ